MADRLFRGVLALVCAAILIPPVIWGGHDGNGLPPSPVRHTARAAPGSVGAAIAAVIPRTVKLASVPRGALRRAAAMSPGERAAQTLLVGFKGTDAGADVFRDLRAHGWGGLVVTPDNALTVDQVGVLARTARIVARRGGRAAPLVVAEPNGSPAEPSLTGSSPAKVRARTRDAALRVSRAGVDLVLDPVVDVPAAGGPLSEEAFSDDPRVVSKLSQAAVEGWKAGGIQPVPGHFPGQGAATQDPLDGPANVGLGPDDLAGRDLGPFRGALAHTHAVMVSSATFTAYDPITPAALVPAITQTLLRGTLRFTGVAMTDDLSSLAVATGRSQPQVAVAALRAGIDLVYVPDPGQVRKVYDAVVAAARSGRLPAARLQEAAARVLELKRAATS